MTLRLLYRLSKQNSFLKACSYCASGVCLYVVVDARVWLLVVVAAVRESGTSCGDMLWMRSGLKEDGLPGLVLLVSTVHRLPIGGRRGRLVSLRFP